MDLTMFLAAFGGLAVALRVRAEVRAEFRAMDDDEARWARHLRPDPGPDDEADAERERDS